MASPTGFSSSWLCVFFFPQRVHSNAVNFRAPFADFSSLFSAFFFPQRSHSSFVTLQVKGGGVSSKLFSFFFPPRFHSSFNCFGAFWPSSPSSEYSLLQFEDAAESCVAFSSSFLRFFSAELSVFAVLGGGGWVLDDQSLALESRSS